MLGKTPIPLSPGLSPSLKGLQYTVTCLHLGSNIRSRGRVRGVKKGPEVGQKVESLEKGLYSVRSNGVEEVSRLPTTYFLTGH